MSRAIQWETIPCPLCGSKNDEHWRSVHDRFGVIPDQIYSIVSCQDCGFRYLNPRPDKHSIQSFYSAGEYDPFLSIKDRLTLKDLLYAWIRKFSLWRKRILIESFRQEGSLLDVGCGTGEFLRYMRNTGWSVAGVEPDQRARQFAVGQGLHVNAGLEALCERHFDAITLWHALEHMHELRDALENLVRLMEKDGVLILAMPNVDSWDMKRYQEEWVALDTPRHLYHFTEKDVARLITGVKLRLIATRNLWLDTLYNVLYSENLYHRFFHRRYRPLYMLNSILGSYIHDFQSTARRASASVYILRRE
ncbi:MAG TPA: methyltransferase domain-containing protein [bacterium]|nr:methyltransferase domain-containing protein [bacterium]